MTDGGRRLWLAIRRSTPRLGDFLACGGELSFTLYRPYNGSIETEEEIRYTRALRLPPSFHVMASRMGPGMARFIETAAAACVLLTDNPTLHGFMIEASREFDGRSISHHDITDDHCTRCDGEAGLRLARFVGEAVDRMRPFGTDVRRDTRVLAVELRLAYPSCRPSARRLMAARGALRRSGLRTVADLSRLKTTGALH